MPDDEIIFKDMKIAKYGYVLFDMEESSLRVVHDYLHSKDIVPFGRYGEWDYLWSDEAILSGKAAAERSKDI